MKMERKTTYAFKQTAMITILLCGIFIVLSVISYEKPDPVNKSESNVSKAVIDYRPLVEQYAEEYGVSSHVDVILGMMMQESGGRGNDPMQASESYCGERNCIEDPELSIKQGVYYFSETLSDAEGDVALAVQSYNFGRGFIDFVQENAKAYSEETAIDFSQEMYQSVPNQEEYRCLREEAEEIGACYGDIYYVRSVMEYRDVIASE
ncbi:lysozyme family protein [Virgibacillus ainsalahensis]